MGMGMGMAADDARKALKKANKLLSPSFTSLRFKADWDGATPLFEQAARGLERAGMRREAQEAFERAAEGQRRLGSELHAVRHLESAAACALKDARPQEAAALYRDGADTYAAIGRGPSLGAQCLCRGAQRLADAGHPDQALTVLDAGVELLEDADAIEGSQAGSAMLAAEDVFKQRGTLLADSGDLPGAARNALRHGAFCSALPGFDGGGRTAARCALTAVALLLSAGEGPDAMHTLSDCCEDDQVAQSSSARHAQALVAAASENDMDAFARAVSGSGVLHDLDNKTGRRLKQLAASEARFAALAESFPSQDARGVDAWHAGVAEEVDEDDLT